MDLKLFVCYQRLLRQESKKQSQQTLSQLSPDAKYSLRQTVSKMLTRAQRALDDLLAAHQDAYVDDASTEELAKAFIVIANNKEVAKLVSHCEIDFSSVFLAPHTEAKAKRAILRPRMCLGHRFVFP
jgi:formyltetrahydrofolate hydrolase